ncbi:MAG: triple tyrosine motif-containing protein, partial [Kangiellaceae bacterium]|nr:triple tyrosine motif-containing protein [Kangiellaceae bacterium]
KNSLSNNRVYSILQDKGGLIWFGTLSGLNIWDPRLANFIHYRHVPEDAQTLTDNTITSFSENKQGILFVGTFNGGLNQVDIETGKVGPVEKNGELISEKRITSLLVDQQERIWLGSMSNGIDIFDSKLNKVKHFSAKTDKDSSLSANGITDIYQDSDGEFWIATYLGGINRLSKDGENFTHYSSEGTDGSKLLVDNTYQVLEDDEGYIWISSDGGGIARLDKNTDKIVNITHENNNPKSLSGNAAWSIFQDSKGRFWIGTQGFGLNLWMPENRRQLKNRFEHFTVENGLISSTVYGVLEDEQGFIWISTNRGVSKLNVDTREFQHFRLADEIHYNEFNQGAFFQLKSGQLFFGGLDGISTFEPEEIITNTHVPNVVLTNIKSENSRVLFDKPIYELDQITLDHNDYLISFEFSALDFTQPSKNRYQYKLEGFDPDWIDIGNLNLATFTNLPSGSYVLKVKGSNNDGVWSDESINLRVNVLPAPWLSWWAFTIYGLAFCVLLLMLIRMQANRLASKEMFKSMVAEQVDKKTKLHIKNNEFLRSQLEQLKVKTNIDLTTGLPNQNFLSVLVNSNLELINQLSSEGDSISWRVELQLIRLDCELSAEELERVLISASQYFETNYSDFKMVRWSEKEIGLIRTLTLEQESQTIDWQNCLQDLGCTCQLNRASLRYPFSGVQYEPINGSEFLMLLEHLLYLVRTNSEIEQFDIIGLTQNLSKLKLKQIMDCDRLEEISDIFVVEQ